MRRTHAAVGGVERGAGWLSTWPVGLETSCCVETRLRAGETRSQLLDACRHEFANAGARYFQTWLSVFLNSRKLR